MDAVGLSLGRDLRAYAAALISAASRREVGRAFATTGVAAAGASGGSLSVAETCLTRAIALDPDAVSARIELAATYRDMGQPERGVPLLKTAASIAQRQGKERQLHEAQDLMRELEH